jgi:hypothetical protein
MKKIFSFIGCVGLMLLALTACSPEEYSSAKQSGIPSIEDINPVIEVDQETNTVVFSIDNPGCYPIWTIDGVNGHPTTNGLTKKYIVAGVYHYSVQIANRNGVAEGFYEGSFEIETTRYDFADAIQKLTGGSSKQWRVYAAKQGHMGCGESLSNPTGWWSAGPYDKQANTIYDDFITFTKTDDAAGVDYSYSAGEDGYSFLNKGVTIIPGTDGSNDFDAPAVSTPGIIVDAKSSLSYDGDNDMVTFTLPAMTMFPYIADNAQLNGATEYYITDLGDKTITVVLNLPGISWQIILINGEDEAAEEEFDPENVNWADLNSENNLAQGFISGAYTKYWYSAAGNWDGNGVPPTQTYADGVFTITHNQQTWDKWNGQNNLEGVSMNIVKDEFYDISININASAAVENVIIKLAQSKDEDPTDAANDRFIFVDENVKLKKGDNVVRWAKRAATDNFTKAQLIIDLGNGVPEGTTLAFSNIIVQKHNPK